jgi:hypothetical protein
MSESGSNAHRKLPIELRDATDRASSGFPAATGRSRGDFAPVTDAIRLMFNGLCSHCPQGNSRKLADRPSFLQFWVKFLHRAAQIIADQTQVKRREC